MSDFFKPDPRITDPALRDLEKKVHWLMYQWVLSDLANSVANAGIDNSNINVPNFPDNFDSTNILNDATDVSKNNT